MFLDKKYFKIASADGRLYAYDSKTKSINWITDLHLAFMNSYHAADFLPNYDEFMLLPALDDEIFFVSRSDGLFVYFFST